MIYIKYTGECATAQISQPDFRPTAQTQQPTVCLARSSTGTGIAPILVYCRYKISVQNFKFMHCAHLFICDLIKSNISSPSSGAHAYSQLRARMHESCMHILDPLRSDHALYARTSTARTMHVWAAPYKMYEAPYIPPYMTGNFRPTGQTQQPTVCLNFRPQHKSIVYFRP